MFIFSLDSLSQSASQSVSQSVYLSICVRESGLEWTSKIALNFFSLLRNTPKNVRSTMFLICMSSCKNRLFRSTQQQPHQQKAWTIYYIQFIYLSLATPCDLMNFFLNHFNCVQIDKFIEKKHLKAGSYSLLGNHRSANVRWLVPLD